MNADGIKGFFIGATAVFLLYLILQIITIMLSLRNVKDNSTRADILDALQDTGYVWPVLANKFRKHHEPSDS